MLPFCSSDPFVYFINYLDLSRCDLRVISVTVYVLKLQSEVSVAHVTSIYSRTQYKFMAVLKIIIMEILLKDIQNDVTL